MLHPGVVLAMTKGENKCRLQGLIVDWDTEMLQEQNQAMQEHHDAQQKVQRQQVASPRA